jgi:DNA-binding response OmpR family regulator
MAKKILIIEDEEILSSLLSKRLEREGYEIVVAPDGEVGVETMKEQKPDLVLLDIVMPKKDGFQVMEEMQADEALSKIPVVIISNSGQPVELDRAKKLGAKDWLVKTEFDPQEVLDKVSRQIGT